MTSGTRMPTWKERENNKRRERRRRAIAAKIFAGLRMYGNYKLPKHCDNNEVLKALCNEAGWTVEPDGTTYRKIQSNWKIDFLRMKIVIIASVVIILNNRHNQQNRGLFSKFCRLLRCMLVFGSVPVELAYADSGERILKSDQQQDLVLTCTARTGAHLDLNHIMTRGKGKRYIGTHVLCYSFTRDLAVKGCKPLERMDIVGGSATASPSSSYHPSPMSSSFPSPASSSYVVNSNGDGSSLIPWLKNLSSASSSPMSSKLPHIYIHSGSISAPVTPPLSSPTARTPRTNTDWEDLTARPGWSAQQHSFLPSSTPPSPGRQIVPDPEWFAGLRIPLSGPTSPTFSLVSSNPFGFKEEVLAGGGSRMWTPGQSGTCSPAIAAGSDHTADVPMSEVISEEFAFGSNGTGLVKPWEGERIHEDCGSDDLELTLGSSRTR
ncbi:hypothetical protein CXB51_029817 [Gossypium anomalum]|uniref:Protein BZR1 homolog n=1 Tax=Gossypium anomalum TaxID=47600 RepID=A0A8J5YBS4_9ROSI|nr:hypothetical protein CXB51_029817 [Gossypium anomalum]